MTDTKNNIISAARHLFAQQGYHGTSVDSIAKKAGVSKGTLYWHFSDKLELYRTVLILEVEKMKQIFRSNVCDVTDMAEFIYRRGRLILEAFGEDPESVLIWMDLLVQAKRGREEFKKIARDLTSYIKKSSDESVLASFADAKKESVFLLLRLVILGLLSCLGSVMDAQEAVVSWKVVVDLVLRGDE